MRVLILHGWMHSCLRYSKLRSDIIKECNNEVDIYEFPGFGVTKAGCYNNIVEYYVCEIRQLLLEKKYDIVIAHSMGGNVILRALEGMNDKKKVILLSPEYNGISILRPLIIIKPLIRVGICFVQLPLKISDYIIKIISLFTINKWSNIDRRIVEDVKRADSKVAVNVMFEMAFDRWRIRDNITDNNDYLLVIGGSDRVVLRKKMLLLQQDLPRCKMKIISNIGHTAIVEDYETLLRIILQFIVGDIL